MKEIKIKCIYASSIKDNNYEVYILDNDKNIFSSQTNKEGYIYFTPPHYGLYKIIIKSHTYPYLIVTNFYYHKYFNETINIFFNNKPNKRKIIIFLTDESYNGLPIMKGELTFWQNTQ